MAVKTVMREVYNLFLRYNSTPTTTLKRNIKAVVRALELDPIDIYTELGVARNTYYTMTNPGSRYRPTLEFLVNFSLNFDIDILEFFKK